MATVTFNSDKPGRASFRPSYANGHHRTVSGTFDFDSSYPTGGENISDIFDAFPRQCLGVIFSASDGSRIFRVDHTNKKVLAYSALGTEVSNATDLSAVTGVRWFAWGI